MRLHHLRSVLSASVLVLLPWSGAAGTATPGASGFCVDPDPPEYYAIELVTTRNLPGTGYVRGRADVTFAPSPFVVSVDRDGSYTYDLHISFQGLKPPQRGRYVAWVTTPQIDRIERVGTLDAQGKASGRVRWNKFLVVVTLETDDDPDQEIWSGPVAFRGMSRSGKMHTMIGHGPLQEEKCAAYGYGN